MNCQTFEPTINDLARGQMMDARERESALAHAEECEPCSARLADEHALSFNLRAFAASVETLEAPAQIETALLAAFRQRNSTSAPPATAAPVVAFKARSTRRWTVWATAAAAAIVTVFAIQAFRLRETPAPPVHTADKTASQPVSDQMAVMPPSKRATPDAATNEVELAGPVREASGSSNPQPVNVNYSPLKNRASRRPRPAAQPKPTEQEIVTDFMPLTYGAAMNPNEGGQLVRVELPRSALASLGLPMNDERSNERVKADVLLGHDGLARAIRFVR